MKSHFYKQETNLKHKKFKYKNNCYEKYFYQDPHFIPKKSKGNMSVPDIFPDSSNR